MKERKEIALDKAHSPFPLPPCNVLNMLTVQVMLLIKRDVSKDKNIMVPKVY